MQVDKSHSIRQKIRLTTDYESVCLAAVHGQGNKAVAPRAIWLDVSRVFATLFIVYFHMSISGLPASAQPDAVAAGKHLLRIPGGTLLFFFMVSGYFCKPGMAWGKWWQRVVSLVAVYVSWNLATAPFLHDEPTLGRIFGIGQGCPFCADYPLWYVRALVLMMLTLPLFRRCVWLYALLALGFVLWGNSWHCSVMEAIPYPHPHDVLAFALGSLFSYVPLERMRRFFLYTLPLWLAYCAGDYALGWNIPHLGDFCGAFLLAGLGAALAAWPAAGRRIAGWADASFLCYAVHAGVLLVAGTALARFCPAAAACPVVYVLLPVLVYAGSMGGMWLMRRYAPALLPWLAHSGKLPFLR